MLGLHPVLVTLHGRFYNIGQIKHNLLELNTIFSAVVKVEETLKTI